MDLEKKNAKFLVFKTSMSQQDSGSTSKSLSKAMSELKLREEEIKTLQ